MANCFSCGRHIGRNETQYKREMYSGRTNKIWYGKRISIGNALHYSYKTVCGDCATRIDQQRKGNAQTLFIVAAVVTILVLLWALIK